MSLRRFDDWPARLDAFIAFRMNTPFAWGSNDCCLFAADAIVAMTGEDFAANNRGKFNSAYSALRFFRFRGPEYGIAELAEELAALRGIREVPPLYAQRGDVMLLERELGESLGIVSLHGTDIWAPGEEKLACVPFAQGLRAWRI